MASIPQLIIADEKEAIAPVIDIIPATAQHISYLKKNLRAEDAAEILRFGITIPRALWYSYKYSLIRKTALIDGVVSACWGCTGVFMGNTGVPWLMTTPEVSKISPLKFARIYQREAREMLRLFPKLENYCDPEYNAALRLLDIVGFTVNEPEKLGNTMVRKFEIRA